MRDELPFSDEDLANFSGWDQEDQKAWDRKLDAIGLSMDDPQSMSPPPKQRKR